MNRAISTCLSFLLLISSSIFSISALAVPVLNTAAYDYQGQSWNTLSYNNVEWLDLNATKGESYNDVQTKLGNELSGWRYASVTDLEDLLINGYSILPELEPFCQFGSQFCDTANNLSSFDGLFMGRGNVGQAINDLGKTKQISSQSYTQGLLGDLSDQGYPLVARLYDNDNGHWAPSARVDINATQLPFSTIADTGSFLVRDGSAHTPTNPTQTPPQSPPPQSQPSPQPQPPAPGPGPTPVAVSEPGLLYAFAFMALMLIRRRQQR